MVALAMGLSLARVLYATPSQIDHEKLICDLAAVNFGEVYDDDGAADGSVTDESRVASLADENAFAPVRSILDLKDQAIPLLIEHLDDLRPTLIKFNGKPVPLGHIALDILIHIAANDRVLIPDCADDGLGACYEAAYYFRPDAEPDQMRKVKIQWRRLYRKGVLKV